MWISDSEADFSYGVHLRRIDSGTRENAILDEDDVAHPEVYAAIDQFRANLGAIEPGIPQKVTTTPDGLPRVIAIDDLVDLAIISLAENATPFEDVGWNRSSADHDVGCRGIGIANQPDLTARGCLLFFYGFLSLYGVPATETVPGIPASITGVTIHPAQPLDPERPTDLADTTRRTRSCSCASASHNPRTSPPWLRESLRSNAIRNSQSDGDHVNGPITERHEEDPLTWVMLTGRPITRWVATSSMGPAAIEHHAGSTVRDHLVVVGVRDPTEWPRPRVELGDVLPPLRLVPHVAGE